MTTPNPLVPQGTNTTPRVKPNIKIAVVTILAIHLVLFGGLLLQGCKRDNQQATGEPTNALPTFDPNAFAAQQAASPAGQPPQPPAPQPDPGLPVPSPIATAPTQPTSLPPLTPAAESLPTPTAAATEYTVKQGDYFEKIAKENGTTVKALAAANPTADSRHLKIGQKLVLPPPTAVTTAAKVAADTATPGFETYVVKSGDNLTKIAAARKTSLKALRTANNLKTDSIKVGQKLKIPVKSTGEIPPAVLPQPTTTVAVPNP